MSDDTDDITKIEDLPDIDRSEESEDFTDLNDMAQRMGISDEQNSDSNDQEDEDVFDDEQDSKSFYESDNDSLEQNESETTSFYNDTEFAEYSPDDYSPSEEKSSDEFNSEFEQSTSTNYNLVNENGLESLDGIDPPDETNSLFSENEIEQHIDNESENLNPILEHDTPPSINDLSFVDELEEIDQKFDSITNPSNEADAPEDPSGPLFEELQNLSPLEKTSIAPVEIDPPIEAPKTLNEIQSFSTESTYGDFQGEANPPFSLIIKNLKYYEDIDSIAKILFELKLDKSSSLESLKTSLQRGQLLIPRLSEYIAIIITHKLRQFDIEISMGLTEEISPPRSYQSNDKGYTSKNTIYKNSSYHKEFGTSSDVLTTSLPQLNDYKVIQHLGLVSHVVTLSQSDFNKGSRLEDQILSSQDISNKEEIEKLRLLRENNLASQSEYIKIDQIFSNKENDITNTDLTLIYKEVIDELKHKALKHKANSILGINFQVLPINVEHYINNGPNYQIMATGNLAWIEKI